jgi:hypothetical protein
MLPSSSSTQSKSSATAPKFAQTYPNFYKTYAESKSKPFVVADTSAIYYATFNDDDPSSYYCGVTPYDPIVTDLKLGWFSQFLTNSTFLSSYPLYSMTNLKEFFSPLVTSYPSSISKDAVSVTVPYFDNKTYTTDDRPVFMDGCTGNVSTYRQARTMNRFDTSLTRMGSGVIVWATMNQEYIANPFVWPAVFTVLGAPFPFGSSPNDGSYSSGQKSGSSSGLDSAAKIVAVAVLVPMGLVFLFVMVSLGKRWRNKTRQVDVYVEKESDEEGGEEDDEDEVEGGNQATMIRNRWWDVNGWLTAANARSGVHVHETVPLTETASSTPRSDINNLTPLPTLSSIQNRISTLMQIEADLASSNTFLVSPGSRSLSRLPLSEQEQASHNVHSLRHRLSLPASPHIDSAMILPEFLISPSGASKIPSLDEPTLFSFPVKSKSSSLPRPRSVGNSMHIDPPTMTDRQRQRRSLARQFRQHEDEMWHT